MLRKRSRSVHKDQEMGQKTSDNGSGSYLPSDFLGQRQKTNSFFNVPGLFVGLSPTSASDYDSVRSPTSPLDFKLFSNLGSPFRFPKPSQDGHQKSWNSSKVGLGTIVDSLDDDNDDDDDDDKNLPKKAIPLSNSKTILFGLQIRSKCPNSPTHAHICEAPKSLPKNYAIFPRAKTRPSNLQKGSSDVVFEIGDDPLESDPFGMIQSFSLDSKRLGSEIYRHNNCNPDSGTKMSYLGNNKTIRGSSTLNLIEGSPNAENKFTSGPPPIARSLTPSEIELSEDYTCVISHGRNPKTTHIFCDCVLDCHPNCAIGCGNKRENSETRLTPCLEISSPSTYIPNDFLSYCHFCKKKLEEGKDIYMYRGEKAFCSLDCRLEEISIEEEKEKSIKEAPGESSECENGDEIFENSIFVT